MPELNNADFYARRERQERALAERAANPAIRNIHLELAQSYVDLAIRAAGRTEAPRPRNRLHLVE